MQRRAVRPASGTTGLRRRGALRGHGQTAQRIRPFGVHLLTWHQVTAEDADSGDIPVGDAIAGRTLSIEPLDDQSGSSAQHPGEIVVESPYLCRGYGSEEVGSLVAFPAPHGVPLFRTGDLGYLDHRGRLRLSGRRDRTVKRRGVRINLDQVERCSTRSRPWGRRPLEPMRQTGRC